MAGAPRHPLIERPPKPRTGWGTLRRDFGSLYAANGLIGVIFSATGPVAVILAVGTQGGLSPAELASWIFGVFFFNGLLTIMACWLSGISPGPRSSAPSLLPGLLFSSLASAAGCDG